MSSKNKNFQNFNVLTIKGNKRSELYRELYKELEKIIQHPAASAETIRELRSCLKPDKSL